MPAMSPTMTEGNISSWKVKEGDSFSTGDVLLEIETDKASMDVEAQDDGVVAKIFAQDGSKSVKVGTRIAVLADPDDDVSSLEIPPDDAKPAKTEADNVKAGQDSHYESSGVEKEIPGTPQNKRPAEDKPKTSPTGLGQNPKYPLYPSVIALIHENHLSDDDVLKIPASGPNGRLLKGDVLAYLGSIESDYPSKQSKRIEHLEHLDLSNIKLLPTPTKPADAPPTTELPSAAAAREAPKLRSFLIEVDLAEVVKAQKRIKDTLDITVPLSTFLKRAVNLANDDLPRPKGVKPSADELFNAVLGLDAVPATSRGTYLPKFGVLPSPSPPPLPAAARGSPSPKPSTRNKRPDIIDLLSGKAVLKRSAAARSRSSVQGQTSTTAEGVVNTFSLTVPQSEAERARTFLERVKVGLEIEPAKLVL